MNVLTLLALIILGNMIAETLLSDMNVLTLMGVIIVGYWVFAMTLVTKIKSWE
jgi:hypothetical protein